MFPRRIQAISVFISFMRLCIHWYTGLFRSIVGRDPTRGHGLGPGGSEYCLTFLEDWIKENKVIAKTRKRIGKLNKIMNELVDGK